MRQPALRLQRGSLGATWQGDAWFFDVSEPHLYLGSGSFMLASA